MCIFATVSASHDNKDGIKSKRAYSLGYNYPYGPYSHFYDHAYHHDTIAHAPTLLHHSAPIISEVHAPAVAKTSVVTTNFHAPLIAAPHPAPLISSAAYVEAHHPIYTEFHRRR